eukprot:TRINITY_DN290_c1_g1_i2.p1 TRINITY_DN290_c1_g1~~TRINITY_DN290_c1_g1_i2.p1  ORF type:complete len:1623 (-),score=570.02 TRINITY_DN290_c1_g1_i2:20056-24924(-)
MARDRTASRAPRGGSRGQSGLQSGRSSQAGWRMGSSSWLSGASASSRWRISSQQSGLSSKPVKCRPQRRAATAVVPLPMKGSSTTPPGGQEALTMRSTTSSGFCVGWSARSLCSRCRRETLHTSLGLQPISSHLAPTKMERERAFLVCASQGMRMASRSKKQSLARAKKPMVSCTDEQRRVLPPMEGTRRSQMISLIMVMRCFSMTKISGELRQVRKMQRLPLGLSLGRAASIHCSVQARQAAVSSLSESLPQSLPSPQGGSAMSRSMLPSGMRASPPKAASASSQCTRSSQPSPAQESVAAVMGSLLQPQFGRAGVRLQAFAIGQFGGDPAQRLRALFRHADHAGTLLEVIHPQRRGEARGPRGGQHVVGAGAVIAQRFGRKTPEEHGTGVTDQVGPLLRLLRRDFQVLGRDHVGNLAGLLHVAHLDQRTAIGQRGTDDVLARHLVQQAVDRDFDLGDVVGIRAQQDGLRQLVVLGLREQVHGDPVGIGGTIADDQDFRGAGDHVDAHHAEHAALGGGHIGIAGADDLVHLRDGRGAIGQRADGLRAADGEDAVHAGNGGGRQHQFVLHAIRRGHDHDDFLHAGHLGRNRIHQHRRGIGGLATGHVDAHAIQRRDLLAQLGAIGFAVEETVGAAFLLLALVIGTHAVGGGLQRMAACRGQAVQGCLQGLVADLQGGYRGGLHAVEALGVFQHGGVAARLDLGQDAGSGTVDGLVLAGLEGQHGRELLTEAGNGGIEFSDGNAHGLTCSARKSWIVDYLALDAFSKASRMGCKRSRFNFSAAWFTTRREEISMMCSTSTSLLARSVPPVLTRSTMASDRPTSGPSSIEPYSLIRSTCTPLAAKCSRAVLTYLVTTRRRAPWRTALAQSKPSCTATDRRHLAMFRSMGWYRPSPPCSSSTSLPATPKSAAPYCTQVGTSEARTMITRTAGSLVGRISLREDSGSSVTVMPAAFNSGRVSSKMRPLESASVSCWVMMSAFLDSGNLLDALDIGTDGRQLGFHAVIATVEVVDALHHRLALGSQAGDHQRGRRAQVGGHHRRADELVHAGDDGGIAFHVDGRAQAIQFLYMHVAVLEDGLGDMAGAFGDAVHRHELRLHVGREARVFGGTEADRLGTTRHLDADPVLARGEDGTGVAQLVQRRVEQAGTGAAQGHVATGGRHRAQEGAGLDAIGNDFMGRAMKLLDTLDHQAIGADAVDLRAHLHQQVGQVAHFGFARGVFQHGLAVRQDRCHQQVLSAGDGDHVGDDARTLQALGLGMDVATLDMDVGTHGLQALDVLVHRTRTDGAATRQRHLGLAEARQQRAQYQDRGAHGLDQLVGCFRPGDIVAVEHHFITVLLHAQAHLLHQLGDGDHVLQMRDIAQAQVIGRQEAGAQDGQGCVLGAGNGDLAGEATATADQELVHGVALFLEFFGGQGLHRQRVDFLAHAVAQRRVDQLVTLDQALAGEGLGDDDGGEVLAIALHFEMLAIEAGGDIAFDEFRCGQHGEALHGNGDGRLAQWDPARSLQPLLSMRTARVDSATKNTVTIPRLVMGAMSDWPKKPQRKPSIIQKNGLKCDTACQNGGSECIEQNTPARKVSGTIRKFWNAANWSNFSAQMPAIKPMVPRMPAPRSANTRIHSGATKSR